MGEVFVGVVSGFSASAFFLIFLSYLRPRIEISSVISVRDGDDGVRYIVKVINRGNRNAVSIRAELSRVRTRIVPDGQVRSTKTLSLRKDSIFSLEKLNKNSNEASYAYRFSTSDDIAVLWDDDTTQFFRFKIYAQDEMSGFGKVFVKDFRTKRNSLIAGEFRHGNSLEIA